MFSRCIWWVGSTLNRSGSDVQHLQICLLGCEAFEGLQSPSEVIGGDKIYEVLSKLIVAVVVEALDGGDP